MFPIQRVLTAAAGHSLADTLGAMRRMTVEAARDPEFRRLALGMVGRLRPEDWWGRVIAIDSRLRTGVPFQPDPASTEFIQEPAVLLQSPAGGDCDDFVTCGCALAEAVGIPTMIGLSGSDGVPRHVFALIQNPYGGEWWPVDFGGPVPPGDWPMWPEVWLP